MFEIGEAELQALKRVIERGKPFRYFEPSECSRFEQRFAEYLGVSHVLLCSSGTAALVAALVGLGIGPGDEVLVPAVTYMATATAVLCAGAIPVIVDVDESLTMCPDALASSIGPRTRAVIAVHMWGLPANLEAISKVAERAGITLVEDVCQATGGAYGAKMLGSFGRASAFSFNYFKNLTCGEGGAICTSDPECFERMRCAVDCANFFWNGEADGFKGFASLSSRASEFEGALLNAQLEQLPRWLDRARATKQRLLSEAGALLTPARTNGEGDCATHAVFRFSEAAMASTFAERAGGQIASETGRHIFTRWTPVLEQRGAHHPALNPYCMQENAECRRHIPPDLGRRSLEIAARSVLLPIPSLLPEREVEQWIDKVKQAALSLG